jgi:cytoskeleton protein RodZ
MSLSLGEKLRQAREERGISVSEVAEQTRISPLYIKAIENDDYKPLPGGIFNKGFVRSYARYIGFDEQEALQDYAEIINTSGIEAVSDQSVHRSEVWTDDTSPRSMAPTLIFAAVILVLLVGGLVLLVRYVFQSSSEPNVANANLTTSPAANNPPANSTLPATVPAVNELSIELKALGEPVWVAYTVDGARTEKTLDAGESVRLDAKDNVKLNYAKVKAVSLEVSINGRKLSIPTANPKGSFDININKSNAAQLIETGVAENESPTQRPGSGATPRPSPRPSLAVTPRPSAPANVAQPRRTP